MIALKDILYKVTLNAVAGNTSVEIRAIDFNSTNIGKNDVFVAIKGSVSDWHAYIDSAIKQGAVAVICEVFPDELINNVTYVEVDSSSKALAIMASNYYQEPSANLKLVGVTGTNGKTTIATLLY